MQNKWQSRIKAFTCTGAFVAAVIFPIVFFFSEDKSNTNSITLDIQGYLLIPTAIAIIVAFALKTQLAHLFITDIDKKTKRKTIRPNIKKFSEKDFSIYSKLCFFGCLALFFISIQVFLNLFRFVWSYIQSKIS